MGAHVPFSKTMVSFLQTEARVSELTIKGRKVLHNHQKIQTILCLLSFVSCYSTMSEQPQNKCYLRALLIKIGPSD